MQVWSEDDWSRDPSIIWDDVSDPESIQRERDAVRLMNSLCDALARNGFWWDRYGWVHKA